MYCFKNLKEKIQESESHSQQQTSSVQICLWAQHASGWSRVDHNEHFFSVWEKHRTKVRICCHYMMYKVVFLPKVTSKYSTNYYPQQKSSIHHLLSSLGTIHLHRCFKKLWIIPSKIAISVYCQVLVYGFGVVACRPHGKIMMSQVLRETQNYSNLWYHSWKVKDYAMLRPKKKSNMFLVLAPVQNWCGDAVFFFFFT